MNNSSDSIVLYCTCWMVMSCVFIARTVASYSLSFSFFACTLDIISFIFTPGNEMGNISELPKIKKKKQFTHKFGFLFSHNLWRGCETSHDVLRGRDFKCEKNVYIPHWKSRHEYFFKLFTKASAIFSNTKQVLNILPSFKGHQMLHSLLRSAKTISIALKSTTHWENLQFVQKLRFNSYKWLLERSKVG